MSLQKKFKNNLNNKLFYFIPFPFYVNQNNPLEYLNMLCLSREVQGNSIKSLTNFSIMIINYPAASSGVFRAKANYFLRGKPRGIYP
jgi:hypothetical protein